MIRQDGEQIVRRTFVPWLVRSMGAAILSANATPLVGESATSRQASREETSGTT